MKISPSPLLFMYDPHPLRCVTIKPSKIRQYLFNNNTNTRSISVVKYNDRHTNIILMNHDGRCPSLILMIHLHNFR